MPELALLYNPDLAKIVHVLYEERDIESDLRQIMINDIIVLTRIASIVLAIAFICLIFEIFYRHVKPKSIRRINLKIRLYYRVLKLRVQDRLLFGFETRYNRRKIRVIPVWH